MATVADQEKLAKLIAARDELEAGLNNPMEKLAYTTMSGTFKSDDDIRRRINELNADIRDIDPTCAPAKRRRRVQRLVCVSRGFVNRG